MEYIDFTKKKIELHKEVENAIKNMMTEKGVTEIDLTQDEAKGIKNQIMTGSYLRPFTVEFTASLKF